MRTWGGLLLAAIAGALLVIGVQHLPRGRESGPAAAPAAPPAAPLAVVDGRPISVDDFSAEMARRGGPASFPTEAARRALLDEMVRTEVLAANGRARGYLDDYGVRRDMLHILSGKYQEEAIDPILDALGVGDDEVSAYYDAHPQSFTIPAAARAAIIYFALRPHAADTAVAATRARAAAVRAEVERQPDEARFAALAAQYSDDQASRYLGGDTGWLVAGQPDSRFAPAVIAAVFGLDRAGQLAPLVETADGLYVIRLVDTRPATRRPLEEVAPLIRAQLLAEKRHRRLEALYAEAARRVEVAVHPERLSALPPPPPVAPQPTGPPPLPGL